MIHVYRDIFRAHLTLDDELSVRHVLHTPQYAASLRDGAREAALDYLLEMAELFEIPLEQLGSLDRKVSFLDPRKQAVEYRFYELKKFFATSTYCFYQTIHNVPLRGGGLTVTVKPSPMRIVHSEHQGHKRLKMTMPGIGQLRTEIGKIPRNTLRDLIAATRTVSGGAAATPAWAGRTRVGRALFYVYRYDAAERQPTDEPSPSDTGEGSHGLPTLPLPPPGAGIRDGEHYMVLEVVFRRDDRERERNALNWKALVEVESGSILWLRPMTSGVSGRVFTIDPKTDTGNLDNKASSAPAVLDPLRVSVTLPNLVAPVGGVQSLTGTNVTIVEADDPVVAVPTKPAGTDFDYPARTNDFAAVSAYYHADAVFATIQGLGFPLKTYFDATTFPVTVDHRASNQKPDGVEVNAFCGGNGPQGLTGDAIGIVGFCLSDISNLAEPLGRSVDRWVHWHEIGGHGILWDHVSNGSFLFAHSAGDTLAAVQNDPESGLRGVPERFQYAPFRDWPTEAAKRFFDRPVPDWAWGSSNDDANYQSEQILATTLFRVYQAIGGDADQVPKRRHASRVASYLVLNAVGHLTPGTNPASPLAFYNQLVAADADDWTTEGLAGGAYNKVLRWSFEQQGLWSGEPPQFDLYIDDGRGGAYPYKEVHWQNTSIWNRVSADGAIGHQPPIEGVVNHAYVRVKNRGTSNTAGVVKLYHCKPGAGLTWPVDFEQVGPAGGIPTGDIAAGNVGEADVGPFDWTPNVNVLGHDCLLAVVTAPGDPSNVDNLEPGQTIAEWRLVPHDNNVGQRNVNLVPGGGGSKALHDALDDAVFFAGNNLGKPAVMELKARVPRVLGAKGWKLGFEGLADGRFRLGTGEKREIRLRVTSGTRFTAAEVRGSGDRTFLVTLLADGMVVGGMSYRMDPRMSRSHNGRPAG